MLTPVSNRTPEPYPAAPGRELQTDPAESRNTLGTNPLSKNPLSRNPLGKEEKPEEECQTCKNRKYKDGSDEMVSFKSPQHVSPENAAAAVRSHEQEHVSNAYKKAAMNDGKVISASVSLHMGICPECGRTYVSGGTTRTQIKYYNEDNPYQKDLKTADSTKYSGRNFDFTL